MPVCKVPDFLIQNAGITICFDCAVDSLNEWLIRSAMKNEYSAGSRTYVVCYGNQVVGYYAIATGSIARGEAAGRIRRNMPDPIPALIPAICRKKSHWPKR
ncbi:MAG: hypothetical protein PF503_05635 [Desulfobacula sp.]|jgi:hypothetical protein|nr:hypothetical protein [Desulfobacula sp.]